jgi:hypothetical protein
MSLRTAFACALLLLWGGPLAAADKSLNLLIVTADDMNADSGSWDGNTLGATPNLDAFAKTAHQFVNSHGTVPICQPGRSALMTGRVPHRNGAIGFNPMKRDVPTLSSGKSFAQRCVRTKDRSLTFHAWVGDPDKFASRRWAGRASTR